MQSALLLAAVVAFILVAMVWPTLRFWRRYGLWPVVFSRRAAPGQREIGALLGALAVAVLAASAARVVLGAERLGIWAAPAPLEALGWALMLGGAALTLVAQRQMGASWRIGIDDRPTELVTRGLYQVVRNPIFTGLLASLAGFTCLNLSAWSLVLWVAAALGMRVQVSEEERHLRARHGESYVEWASRVGRLVPWIGRL